MSVELVERRLMEALVAELALAMAAVPMGRRERSARTREISRSGRRSFVPVIRSSRLRQARVTRR
jgi:hypothetical protein